MITTTRDLLPVESAGAVGSTPVTRVTLIYCPRCGGNLLKDDQDRELLACLNCARRYIAPESLHSRPPTPLEESRKQRHAYALSERRMA